jgi:MFS family permease
MSGTLAQLEDTYSLTNIESGVVMSALALGSVVGCVVGGPLCDTLLGRWKTIQIQNIMFFSGIVLCVVAQSFAVIVIGR